MRLPISASPCPSQPWLSPQGEDQPPPTLRTRTAPASCRQLDQELFKRHRGRSVIQHGLVRRASYYSRLPPESGDKMVAVPSSSPCCTSDKAPRVVFFFFCFQLSSLTACHWCSRDNDLLCGHRASGSLLQRNPSSFSLLLGKIPGVTPRALRMRHSLRAGQEGCHSTRGERSAPIPRHTGGTGHRRNIKAWCYASPVFTAKLLLGRFG